MKKTILVGGGGHAISLLETLENHLRIEGYADIQASDIMPINYLGDDEYVLSHYLPDAYDIQVTLVYTSKVDLQLRKRIIEKYKDYTFHSFVAQSALLTKNAIIGQGCVIMEKAIVNHSQLGENCIVNTGAIIEHNCKIGNNVFIGPGAIICGGVSIGDNTLIGAGVIVRDDCSVTSDTVVGMGSVVTKSIVQPGVYTGLPATINE